ncbi:MAG: DUF192 domain-containing protein [Opitutaceae bacterium]
MKIANSVSIRRGVSLMVLVASCASVVTGCGDEAAAPTTAVKSVADYFDISVGGKLVRMQLAVGTDEMQRGLMERTTLGRDEGMLFVYNRPQSMSFWMRNTPTPLDIGFFDRSGILQEIYPLHPFDEMAVRSRSSNLQLALEMNQRWYHENAVKPGASIDLKALAAALKARGFDADKFGLGLGH